MPRTRAAASWVSPSVRRRRRSAERMQACASPVSRVAFTDDPALNSRASMAAPDRADFDRYSGERAPRQAAIWSKSFRYVVKIVIGVSIGKYLKRTPYIVNTILPV